MHGLADRPSRAVQLGLRTIGEDRVCPRSRFNYTLCERTTVAKPPFARQTGRKRVRGRCKSGTPCRVGRMNPRYIQRLFNIGQVDKIFWQPHRRAQGIRSSEKGAHCAPSHREEPSRRGRFLHASGVLARGPAQLPAWQSDTDHKALPPSR